MTEHQIEQLKSLEAEWEGTVKISKYLWESVAHIIKNSITRVLEGKNTIQELEDALGKSVHGTKEMAIRSYYESALDNVKKIIAGGSI